MSTSQPKYKVLVTHSEVPKTALDLLESSHCELIRVSGEMPPKRAELLEKAKGVDALFWATHEPLNAEVLDTAGPQLKSVSTMSAGVDYVDIEEFKKRKIPLGHTPDVLSNAVADLAIGLMVAAARRFHEGRQKIETSTWLMDRIEWMWGRDIRDSVVGFYGFGHIGQTIAERLSGFNIQRIIYHTRKPVSSEIEEEHNASHVSFADLLTQSDILFVVAPLTAQTKGIFNSAAFNKMKNTAVFVNVARGGIVKQQDLYEALKNNKIFAAGLDVMDPEPLPPNDPLMSLPNCVLVPHLGSATGRTRTDMAIIAAHNVLRGIAGEPLFAPVY